MSAQPSYYIDHDRGCYLRSRVHKGYIATFQESATEQDKALIKASPKLLFALQQLLARTSGDHYPVEQQLAEEAISEATGSAS